ncbi:unnamed protein product, partial [Pylaiella littoralis]
HQFVKALGTKIIEDGVVTGLHLERQELVKFVALAYFVKNKSLFANALPGYQVTGDKHGGEVDDTRRWVEAIQERTAEKWYGAGNLSKSRPELRCRRTLRPPDVVVGRVLAFCCA